MMLSYDCRKIARDSLKGNWGIAIAAGIIVFILGGSGLFGFKMDFDFPNEHSFGYYNWYSNIWSFFLGTFTFAALLIKIIIGGVTEIGYKKFNMSLVNNEKPRFESIFDYYSFISKGIAMVLLRWLFIFLWSLLFVIPGIVAAYRYALMPYIIADNPDISVMEAMEQSKMMMRGNKMRLFCLQLTFLGWEILAVLTFGIGFLWLAPYMAAAEAAFYENVKSGISYNGFSDTHTNSNNNDNFDHINWDE